MLMPTAMGWTGRRAAGSPRRGLNLIVERAVDHDGMQGRECVTDPLPGSPAFLVSEF